jgi:vitamin B12 transporter
VLYRQKTIGTGGILHKTITAALLLTMMLAAPAFAEKISPDNIVVTPARLQEAEGSATSPVTVIRRAGIERMGLAFLDDLLRRIGVVQVIRDGAGGAGSRLLVRGTDPAHSLILIDGVRVLDGWLDLSGITLEDVERIEISRGTHSVSYGSQAIGGVVNIITRKGGGKFNIDLSYAQGANETKYPSVTVSGGKKYRYRLSASAPESEGTSSIAGGTEPDGYEARSYSGHLAMPLGKGGVFEVSGRRGLMEASLDRDPAFINSVLADDPDLTGERRRELLMTKYTYSETGAVVHMLTVSEWEEKFTMDDPTYAIMNAAGNSYRSEALTSVRAYDYQANIYEEEGGVGIIGLERREETASRFINSGAAGGFMNTVALNAAYMNLKMEDGPYTFVFGARRTEHEASGDHATYRVSALQQDEGSTLSYRGAYSTGLRLPTALELELSGGAPLRPELGRSWEAGFEKHFGKGSTLGLVYFDQELTDLLERDPATGVPANRGSARIKGVEVKIAGQSQGKFGWSLTYTWLEAEDPLTSKPLPLRPEDRVDLSLGYGGGSLALQADYSYVGRRPGEQPGTELGSYGLLNLGGSYRIGKTFTVFGRVDNALDEEYRDRAGYSAPMREYHAGLRAKF